jgi:hypothetical protein
MSVALRVFMIEDSENDEALSGRDLRRGGKSRRFGRPLLCSRHTPEPSINTDQNTRLQFLLADGVLRVNSADMDQQRFVA